MKLTFSFKILSQSLYQKSWTNHFTFITWNPLFHFKSLVILNVEKIIFVFHKNIMLTRLYNSQQNLIICILFTKLPTIFSFSNIFYHQIICFLFISYIRYCIIATCFVFTNVMKKLATLEDEGVGGSTRATKLCKWESKK